MSLKYLLDTNIISEAKRPLPNQNVIKNLSLYSQEIATAMSLMDLDLKHDEFIHTIKFLSCT
ncbi:hypothetical protein WEU38_18110 [Cyanobacterium aponinum AL20118]|uniref:PilT protein domain protein n=2 Tax=Cyanobacterium aponinum TaxID=379064 RepID=K9Z9X1_CYAAP|nr:hypothetical protein [Cyanobacterium aponinum]AFZ55517.1 hypothetical protein Cyan10605_3481 [Cyanobacterium aponinum PCC 10605]WPF88694.1 hypothetical protein SAY89_18200 [Cyanobacterium aponinum AL20115]